MVYRERTTCLGCGKAFCGDPMAHSCEPRKDLELLTAVCAYDAGRAEAIREILEWCEDNAISCFRPSDDNVEMVEVEVLRETFGGAKR